MTLDAYLTAIGTILIVLGGVWGIVTYKTKKLEEYIESMDDRIFYLATGKTLKEAILEAKAKKD
jgi:hypothetical protein